MDAIQELQDLVGPDFHVQITVKTGDVPTGRVYVLDLEARPVTGPGSYWEVARKFGELYLTLMAHERWITVDDPDVHVRYVEIERPIWQLDGTLARRPTYGARGEGTITLVRTSRD